MPTLGTGNDAGFTLIEILAVIILVGLIFALAFPNFILSEERTEIIQIGKLISSDLKLIKEDSLEDKSDVEVEFTGNGYRFTIGATNFTRTFNRFGFGFQLLDEKRAEDRDVKSGEPSSKKDAEITSEKKTDRQTDDNTATESKSDDIENQAPESTAQDITEDDSTSADQAAEKSGSIIFKEDGTTGKLDLDWQSNHFKGKLAIDETGKVKWSYEKR